MSATRPIDPRNEHRRDLSNHRRTRDLHPTHVDRGATPRLLIDPGSHSRALTTRTYRTQSNTACLVPGELRTQRGLFVTMFQDAGTVAPRDPSAFCSV